MSELTQTYLNSLVTAYGAAAARAARAPRNTSAARYAFEIENEACASLLTAIGSLVADREKLASREGRLLPDSVVAYVADGPAWVPALRSVERLVLAFNDLALPEVQS